LIENCELRIENLVLLTRRLGCDNNIIVSKKKFAFIASFFLLLALISAPTILADNGAVLGTTATTTIQIPATPEGPGLILPDSPLFFLDELKQRVRVFLAFTPEARAQVHANIAGERLAELRIMLARNNTKGILIDLKGISDNLTAAADDLSQAQFSGKNVNMIAQTINQSIKRKQDTLDSVESQIKGNLKKQVSVLQDSVFRAKVRVGSLMPQDLAQTEMFDDLTRKLAQQVQEASESSQAILVTIGQLGQVGKNIATTSSQAKQDTLKKAIDNTKNQQVRETLVNLLAQEQLKSVQLLKLQDDSLKQASQAASNAQQAAVEFKKSQDALNQLRSSTYSITVPLK